MNKELKESKSYLDEERYNIAINSNIRLLLALKACKKELLNIIKKLTPNIMTKDEELDRKEIESDVSIHLFEIVQQEALNKVRNNLVEATNYLKVTNDNIKNILSLSEKVKSNKSYLHQDEYDITLKGYARMLALAQACKYELLKIIAQLKSKDEASL